LTLSELLGIDAFGLSADSANKSLSPKSISPEKSPKALIPYADNGTLNWIQATAAAPWAYCCTHNTLVFDEKIWVIIGYLHPEDHHVWYSSDGVNWTSVMATPPWCDRGEFQTVVFHDMMWVLGGFSYDVQHDVWYSTDGVDWIQATGHAAWHPRAYHQSIVFDNKIWVIGGEDPFDIFNDVWYSSDGANWTEATDNAIWGMLAGFSTTVFRDKMWVIGGFNYSYRGLTGGVWSSEDGAYWTYEGDCGARIDQEAVVAGGGIWLTGGDYGGDETNSVWSSTDGANWNLVTCNSHWSARESHAIVNFDGKIWVLGGIDDYGVKNDVWYAEVFNAHFSGVPVTDTVPLTVQFTDESISVLETITGWLWDFGDGTTSTEQHPVHTYDLRGLYDVSLTVTSASNTDTETKTGYIHVTDAEHPYHSADRDQDHKISLSELLRIIQFYNSGGLHCQSGTEDGYDPGMGDQACDLHDSDYNPPDWTIKMSELLRIIQLFRSPGYYPCIDGEDGFCVD